MDILRGFLRVKVPAVLGYKANSRVFVPLTPIVPKRTVFELNRRFPLVAARLRPLVDPVVHGFVPELRVLRLQYPVSFVGEIQHLARNMEQLKSIEELKTLRYIEPVVELAVNDQCRCLEVFRVEGGR